VRVKITESRTRRGSIFIIIFGSAAHSHSKANASDLV